MDKLPLELHAPWPILLGLISWQFQYRPVRPADSFGYSKEYEMAYKITDACNACGACKEACPSEAIKEGEEKYSVDPELCIDCGACVETCPTGAIVEE